jgi:hypothetical protein
MRGALRSRWIGDCDIWRPSTVYYGCARPDRLSVASPGALVSADAVLQLAKKSSCCLAWLPLRRFQPLAG